MYRSSTNSLDVCLYLAIRLGYTNVTESQIEPSHSSLTCSGFILNCPSIWYSRIYLPYYCLTFLILMSHEISFSHSISIVLGTPHSFQFVFFIARLAIFFSSNNLSLSISSPLKLLGDWSFYLSREIICQVVHERNHWSRFLQVLWRESSDVEQCPVQFQGRRYVHFMDAQH